MQEDNTLQGDLFGDMVLEQAIADKTAMYEKEMMAAQDEADLKNFGIQGAAEEDKEHVFEEDFEDDPDFAMGEEEERMLAQMKLERIEEARALHTEKRENIVRGHGTYQEIVEQEFLPTVTATDYVICAFFHKDFERCKIVDKHFFLICKAHPEARFVRIDAEKCPFFIQKLSIQTLPTIILFENGVAIDRIIGFEELGGDDDFPTMNMVRRLVRGGVLIPKNKSESGQMRMKRQNNDDSDASDD